MNNKFTKICIIIISVFFLQTTAHGKQTISFGLVPGFRPITFVNDRGQPDGFAIELYTKIMDEFGYEPEFVIGSFKDLYKKLLSNDLDFFGTLTRRSDRESLFFWPNEPTITGWGQLFVAHGKAINSINEIRGEKIGLVSQEAKGKSFINHMKSLSIPFETAYFPSFDELIDAVILNKVIAGIANNTIVATNAKIDPTGFVFAPSSAYSTTAVDNVRIIPLVKRFNDRMAELKSDHNSYYWELYQKWFSPTRIKTKVIPGWLIWLVAALGGGMIIFFIISRVLKVQVLSRTAELEEFTQRLSIHVEQTPLGVIEWDLDFTVTQWNNAAKNIFGYSKEEAVGRTGLELIIPKEVHNLVQPIWNKLVSGKGGRRSTNENITKDGKLIVCEWYNTTLLDSNGIIIGVASLVQDITNQKNFEEEKTMLERQLQQSQKMEAIGALAGGIAHDFNNILTIILGYSDMLKTDLSLQTSSNKDLDEIIKAGNRAKDLVRQILTFSRQHKKEFIPIQPDLIIKEALKMLRSSIPSTIKIESNVPKSGSIIGDPTQLHQIMMNLCTNAYHAMRKTGGILSVLLEPVNLDENDIKVSALAIPPGSFLKLEISDNGHGMDKATQQKIFDPYFTTKKIGEGTGLGLSVVHGIVKNFGGHISVYSEPDKGTTFRIYFPQTITKTETAPIKFTELNPTGHEHILVVDDEISIVVMEKRMLESLGYQISACTSSPEALKIFQNQSENIALVITDMTMPDMTGIELIQSIRAIRPNIPIILCSGFNELIDEKNTTCIPDLKYLNKPVLKRNFALAIRGLLDNSKRPE
jgi:PAS domain S-box-containing protein